MFSLIEGIVALGFLGIAVTGFVAAANFGLRGIAEARSDDLSASVARNVLDDVRATLIYDSAGGVVRGTRSFNVTEPSPGGANVTYAVTVNVTPELGEGAEVLVSATGPDGRTARMSEEITYVAPPPGDVVGAGSSRSW